MSAAPVDDGTDAGDGCTPELIESWWAELRTAALVGTARRAAPAARPLAGASPGGPAGGPERLVLDGVALLGPGRRAGLVAAVRDDPLVPAAGDERRVAPAAAVQMLELLLDQAPAAGLHRDELLRHWYETCAASGHRLPERLLVGALRQVGTTTGHRVLVRAVLGERGRWLAAQNPQWAWAAGGGDPQPGDRASSATVGRDGDEDLSIARDPEEWARRTARERLAALTSLRATDPAAARSLLRTTWSTDGAPVRAAHLAVLVDQLGPEDEDLLEHALDDRARSVREVAARLLDGLPTSARAARMGARLDPLVTVKGRARLSAIDVELPGEPDAAAVRDGLGPPPPKRSARGWWLERMVAGAPLTFWTDLTGGSVEQAVKKVVRHVEEQDVRRGLLAATVAQRDPAWAAALFESVRDPRLLEVVPAGERDPLVVGALRAKVPAVALPALLAAVPAPWSAKLSALVVAMARDAPHPAVFLQPIGGLLAEGLDDLSVTRLESWLAELRRQESPPPQPIGAIRAILQHRSLHRAITEAFA